MCVGTLGLKTARRLKVPTEAHTQRERMYPERQNVPREKEYTDTHSIIGVGTSGAGQAMA